MATETLVELLQRLHEQGYEGQCRAETTGLRFLPDGGVVAPADVQVDQVIRLEGTSAPGEQTIVFAVTTPDRARQATYCVCFGPDTDPLDADMMQELDIRAADDSAHGFESHGSATQA